MADMPYTGRFVGGEHRFALRVYFEDTDFSGVVYHARYLHFLERARSDMLALAGIDQRGVHDAGGGAYAVTHVDLAFRAPARFDDALLILSRVTSVRAASCIIAQRIERAGTHILDATVTAALIGPDGRPRRQPGAWRERFEAIRTGALHE